MVMNGQTGPVDEKTDTDRMKIRNSFSNWLLDSGGNDGCQAEHQGYQQRLVHL